MGKCLLLKSFKLSRIGRQKNWKVRVPQLQTLQRSIKVDHCNFDSGGEKRNARKPVAPAGREGRWVGAISANACGPNISWPRALGPHHHHQHQHLGAARPDQSGPCSGSSVAAQRASWSSPEIASDPDIQLFCFVLPCLVSRGIGTLAAV